MGSILSLFLDGPFVKSLLNMLHYCFCFMFWFFGGEACGLPGIKPAPATLEVNVLTTGPPGSPWTAF